MKRIRLLIVAATTLLAGACEPEGPVTPQPQPKIGQCVSGPSTSLSPAPQVNLDPLFASAAREFGVPEALLKALGYVETRWQMVEGEEVLNRPAAFGVMGLRGEALRVGAQLAEVSTLEARTSPEANIRAAAALLRSYATELGEAPLHLADWAPVVARYSGIDHAAGRESYVHDAVYATLRRGARSAAASLHPVDVAPRLARTTGSASASKLSIDFEGAVWRPSPNFNQRAAGDPGKVMMVIIHTCEGGYTGCWSWLTSQQSQVSAHYVVNESGTEVSQLVRESARAWHIGAIYDCSLNANLDCGRTGVQSNHFTVGIEHGGFAAQTTWPSAQIDVSARLVCDIARRHGITRDNLHIAAHGQLQPHNRTDPGPHWPWADYLERINRHCGGRSPSAAPVIDNNNALNDTTRGYFRAPGGWATANTTAGFYGTGYHVASSGARVEPVSFYLYNPAPATRTVAGWWTSGANRSRRVPFVALGPDGRELGRVELSQQQGGSRWNTLATWSFPAGWSRIQLSPNASDGCVAIADALVVN